MRQELINETKSHCDRSSYVVHFMGLNGIKNFEPSDSNKQCKVVYSQMTLKRTTNGHMRFNPSSKQ